MSHEIDLDKLKRDLDDLAVDLLTPPEKLDVITLLEDKIAWPPLLCNCLMLSTAEPPT